MCNIIRFLGFKYIICYWGSSFSSSINPVCMRSKPNYTSVPMYLFSTLVKWQALSGGPCVAAISMGMLEVRRCCCLLWSKAKNWAQWWLRPRHLKMLHKDFSAMDGGAWDKVPTTTNAVEHLNGECKTVQPVALQCAVTDVYKLDKSVCAKHLAAIPEYSVFYREKTDNARRLSAALQHLSTKAASSGVKELIIPWIFLALSWLHKTSKQLHTSSPTSNLAIWLAILSNNALMQILILGTWNSVSYPLPWTIPMYMTSMN